MKTCNRIASTFAALFLVIHILPATAAKPLPKQLPAPDGKSADMSKPVQVYILLGQSNMVGAGKIKPRRGKAEGSLEHAVKQKKLYPYLVDDAGNWTVRKDVRNVRVMGSGGSGARTRLFNNEWMTIKGRSIGPEIGIGHNVGHATDAPVLILKSCIGNRSLGWDLLPPGSERYEFKMKDRKSGELKTYVYPAYNDKIRYTHWEKGTVPKPPKHNWHAGLQYEGDVARAKKVLSELDKYYPGAKKYEVAGFFFWQGDKDRYNAGHAGRYEKNLVQFIKQLRKDFNAPKAKFVCATLGQTKKGSARNENEKKILEAQLAVDGKTGKYPEFKGNVATVYTHPLSKGGASNSHYGGNAETYMNVGEAMGRAMVELLKADSK
ncbi:MAG: sialate O-acetylesterase [Planctomycetaceae bacterium]